MRAAVAILVLMFGFSAGLRAETVCPFRWVHISNSLTTEGKFLSMSNVVEEASASGFNGIVWASGIDGEGFDFHRWSGARRDRLFRMRRLCDACGMEIVPLLWSVGRAHALVNYDVNLAEAQPVRDVPYVSLGKTAVFEPETNAVEWMNGPFAPLESAVSRRSAKDARTWIEPRIVKTPPYRRFRLSFEVRTEGVVKEDGVPPRSAATIDIYRRYGGKLVGPGRESLNIASGDTGWMSGCLDFTTSSNVETRVGVGFAWMAKYGTVQFRNLDIRPLGLQKVIRRPGAPMTVRSAETGRAYVEGRDWVLVGETHPEPENGLDRDFTLTIPNGSAIAKGERLLISAYTAVRRSTRQIGVCMANPALYDCFEQSMTVAVELFGPCRRWFMPMDEIRSGGSCEACRGRRLGELLADCLCRQRDIVRRHVPGAEIYVWPDMFSPYGNATPDDANRDFELCEGSFWPISDRIPRDIAAAVWNEGKISEELDYFNRLGIPTVFAGFYDAQSVDVPRGRPAMEKIKQAKGCRGYIYSTWNPGGKYDLLREYGAALNEVFGELPKRR